MREVFKETLREMDCESVVDMLVVRSTVVVVQVGRTNGFTIIYG